MRLVTLTTLGVLLTAGIATAGPQQGEETLAIDLTSIPEGPMLFVKCSRSHSLTNCGLVSIWEQTNNVAGLQTTKFSYGGKPREADSPLLP